MHLIVISLLGLIVGSLLNVCVHRIPQNQSIAFPASHCPSCKVPLKWWQLIPVLSYVFLKGRCGHCARKISVRYPAIELLNGFLYLGVYSLHGLSWTTFIGCFLISTLVVVSFIDLDHRIIPNKIVLFLILMAVPLNLLSRQLTFTDMLLGFLVGGGLLAFIALVSKGGMGGGDIKLMAALGLYLGWQNTLMSIFLGSLLGSVVGIVLMLVFRLSRKTRIPFGPFLALGTVLTYVLNDRIFNAYFWLAGW